MQYFNTYLMFYYYSFDSALQSVKSCVGGNDELSDTFLEMKGHFYMHAGSLLLKMGQHSDVQWRALSELAALCYLIAFQVIHIQFCMWLTFWWHFVVFHMEMWLVHNENMNKSVQVKTS